MQKTHLDEEKKEQLFNALTDHLDLYIDDIPDIMLDFFQINPEHQRDIYGHSTTSGAL